MSLLDGPSRRIRAYRYVVRLRVICEAPKALNTIFLNSFIWGIKEFVYFLRSVQPKKIVIDLSQKVLLTLKVVKK